MHLRWCLLLLKLLHRPSCLMNPAPLPPELALLTRSQRISGAL
jgi:hypothetical protein